jgi:hypothetical protein
MARCCAIAAARPCLSASFSFGVANADEHQPPLRPDAPKPAISFSRITTLMPESAFLR